MLQESQNMYAETVVKTIGAEQGGEGSWDAGLRCAAGMLRDLHFKDEEFKLADGGGMSRTNRLPPALLCAVLMDMNRSQYKGVLAELLAAPGEEGTLERRFKDPEYARRIRAKTGYLRGVGALSGYVEAKSGLHVTFSILINDFRDPSGNLGMKDVEDRIACAIVDHAR
jgi:D-alanyl-D-alanine carboxypeptidase/D-alanyl-D-alanine-endopeptidase (penicillin-binding protein 4)